MLLLAGAILSWAIPRYELLNPYLQAALMYLGINIILAIDILLAKFISISYFVARIL